MVQFQPDLLRIMSYRIYTSGELQRIKLGTVFHHLELGKCILVKDREDGRRRMIFKSNRLDYAYFMNDNWPWNKEMRIISGGGYAKDSGTLLK